MYTNIFDTHAHYTDAAFDADREELLGHGLPEGGVALVMLAACSVEDTRACIRLTERYPYIWSSAGVHPENVDDLPADWLARIRDLAQHEKVRAIGEIGLDYHYEGYDAAKQREVLCAQLELAQALDLPVILHVRDAMGDALEILRKYRPKGVMHCYGGSAETAKELVKLGLHISFTGVLTFKNARKAVETMEILPIERFMLETDSPYMAPVPLRGKRCDSRMIAHTAERAAAIKGMDTQSLIDICCENGRRLFGIPDKCDE